MGLSLRIELTMFCFQQKFKKNGDHPQDIVNALPKLNPFGIKQIPGGIGFYANVYKQLMCFKPEGTMYT